MERLLLSLTTTVEDLALRTILISDVAKIASVIKFPIKTINRPYNYLISDRLGVRGCAVIQAEWNADMEIVKAAVTMSSYKTTTLIGSGGSRVSQNKL